MSAYLIPGVGVVEITQTSSVVGATLSILVGGAVVDASLTYVSVSLSWGMRPRAIRIRIGI